MPLLVPSDTLPPHAGALFAPAKVAGGFLLKVLLTYGRRVIMTQVATSPPAVQCTYGVLDCSFVSHPCAFSPLSGPLGKLRSTS
jgi:hypothetical protein